MKQVMLVAACGLLAFSGPAFAGHHRAHAPVRHDRAHKDADADKDKGDAVHGQQVFARCTACHVLGQTGGKMGPALNGVVGRKAGTAAGYA